ncbi:MAG: proline dehydrogenase family protein [Saprospiraceae bacterium]
MNLDFNNTKIAFSNKSDGELKKASWLFGMMNQSWLVSLASKLGIYAVEWDLPFAETLVKNTIFEQFCGGVSLEDCKTTISKLYKTKTLTILDYGAEAKESEADFDNTMQEFIKAINFAATTDSVPIVSIKVTGMARFALLEKANAKEQLNSDDIAEFERIRSRVDQVCATAKEKGIAVFVDAEESWIQDPVDDICEEMMAKYNKEKITVYNTYQMYRHDRLNYLKASFQRSIAGNYILGAKLVRGAYMEKERLRAEEMKYLSPINATKEATDKLYNEAVKFVVENYQKIASCCATHNAESTMIQARMIDELGIPKDHPHLTFCQLYGMSDNITFNLSNEGYLAGKYLPYGSVRDVIPYLLRRAQENTSVSGDMGREYQFIVKEIERRGK